MSQQAEKSKDSATQKKSRESRRRREEQSPDDDDEVISRSQKSIEVSVESTTQEVIVQNIQMIVENIVKIEVHQLQFSHQMADVQLRCNDDCQQLRSGEHQ